MCGSEHMTYGNNEKNYIKKTNYIYEEISIFL